MKTIAGMDGLAGPPNLPVDKVKIIEEAFIKAATEPEFLDWAKGQL